MLSKHKKQNTTVALLALCGIGAFAGALHAEVVFDNFNYTPGEPMYGFLQYGINVNDPDGIPDFAFGQTFVVSGGDYTFDTMIAPILYSSFIGGLNEGLTLSLHTNGGDGLPDLLLESATFSNLPEIAPDDPVATFNFSGNTVLQDGQRYWITATVPTDDGEFYSFGWGWNVDFKMLAPYAVSQDGGPWASGVDDTSWLPQAAFRIEGTLVPAPGALAGMAAIGLIGTRRRR